jgi:cyclophilin family peptidyl-prolyl cis-trans isomerase
VQKKFLKANKVKFNKDIELFSKSYKNTKIYRNVNKFALCGGDIQFNDGNGGLSFQSLLTHRVTSLYFDDENYALRHNEMGVLGMLNNGKRNTNSSQFFINLQPNPHLDGRYVAFGRMLEGKEILKEISEIFTIRQAPTADIVIKDCGKL